MIVGTAWPMDVFYSRWHRFRLGGNKLRRISKAGDLFSHILDIDCVVMLDCHGPGGDGNRNILNARHAPDRRIDFGCTRSAVHALDPESRLKWLNHIVYPHIDTASFTTSSH